ncbi:TetR/AcrR family transcriptional regulator C-terminal domain-containing protein [Actinomadura vinacea]|uniref:TetR/AcrR family transcriptional regulator C-terminal domain-containing protein n=1 Tax=Actinomadura vinacea TaxID=115336 RepID=A0ABP5W978_9ACTN
MPRDTLTRDQIVRAAIDLLDAEGLEGLSMRALGRRLGSAATAVYWHVGSKDNLIALAADRVWNEIALPDLSVVDWRTAATRMAADLHTMLTRHPWLVEAFGSFLLPSLGKARRDDHTLAIYEAAGFTGARADQAAAAVFTYVLGNALGPAAAASLTRRLNRNGGNADELMRDHMAKASEIAAQFPRLQSRLDTAADRDIDYAAAPDDSFDFGLQALLDGLEAKLPPGERRRSQNPGGSDAPLTRERPTPTPGSDAVS